MSPSRLEDIRRRLAQSIRMEHSDYRMVDARTFRDLTDALRELAGVGEHSQSLPEAYDNAGKITRGGR